MEQLFRSPCNDESGAQPHDDDGQSAAHGGCSVDESSPDQDHREIEAGGGVGSQHDPCSQLGN